MAAEGTDDTFRIQRESRTRFTSFASCLVVYERFATVAFETIHVSSRLSEMMDVYSLPPALTPCTKSPITKYIHETPPCQCGSENARLER